MSRRKSIQQSASQRKSTFVEPDKTNKKMLAYLPQLSCKLSATARIYLPFGHFLILD